MNNFCSTSSSKEVLIGTTSLRKIQIVLEVPEPWEKNVAHSTHYPHGLNDKLRTLLKRGIEFSLIAVKPKILKRDLLRIFCFRQKTPYGPFSKDVYLVPRLAVVSSIENILQSPDEHLTENRIEENQTEVLVCTHEARDACCGKFGKELYLELAEHFKSEADRIRIYESSHIGGHRFAPTLMLMPQMTGWGRLTFQTAVDIIEQKSQFRNFKSLYRGYAGFQKSIYQICEMTLLDHYGWDLFKKTDLSFSMKSQTDHGGVVTAQSDTWTADFDVNEVESVQSFANCTDLEQDTFRQYQVNASYIQS